MRQLILDCHSLYDWHGITDAFCLHIDHGIFEGLDGVSIDQLWEWRGLLHDHAAPLVSEEWIAVRVVLG